MSVRRPTRPLRVCAVGAGWVTTNRHIPTMQADPGYEVVALVDRDGERAREAAGRLGIRRHAQAADLSQLDLLDEVDAVTCGTSPFAHHEVVRGALEAGKHVLTEKPFTLTVEEGEELVALARERGLTLAVVHNFQFARSALEARGWLERGRLGALRGIWAMQLSNPRRRLPTWFDELPLGLFFDEAPHLLYLTRAFAGGPLEPLSVTVHPSTIGHANTPAQIDAQLRAGGMPVMLQMSFEAPLSEWHVALLGERGLATVDLFRDIAVFTPNDGGHGAKEVLRSSASTFLGHWRGYVRSGAGHVRGTLRYGNEEVFRRFREAVAAGTEPAGIGPDDALEVLRLQRWIVGAQPPVPAQL